MLKLASSRRTHRIIPFLVNLVNLLEVLTSESCIKSRNVTYVFKLVRLVKCLLLKFPVSQKDSAEWRVDKRNLEEISVLGFLN